MAKKTCQKCGRAKEQVMFYTYKTGQKAQICKECTLMHVNIWQPDTFVWLLQKYDVPWLPWEWNSLREKAYIKNPKKKNDTTVFGKYLSKMKLRQWKDKHWADTEQLQKEHELEVGDQAEKQLLQNQYAEQYANGEITQAQYRTLVSVSKQKELDINSSVNDKDQMPEEMQRLAVGGDDNYYDESKFIPESEIPDLGQDLTDEDKKYLAMKWGRYYRPAEWVQLQTFYNEMMNSFDIQDADTRSTLILICKNNLKMNQAIDQGDLQGYQKLARVSDTLRKSAKFTAAQNKEQSHQFIDSVGQLVSFCEKHGGEIPKIEITTDLDIVDTIIKDLKTYTKSLVYEDPALKRQIEDYLKEIKNNESRKKDLEEAEKEGLDYVEIKDQDIQQYNKEIIKQQQQDKENEKEGGNKEEE